MSHKGLLAPCLLFVGGVFCLDVISTSLFLFLACTGEDAACFLCKPVWTEDYCRGRKAKRKNMSPIARMLGFSAELVHAANTRKKKKTQKHKY